MKYLRFVSQNNVPSQGNNSQSDFAYVLNESLGKVNNYNNNDICSIEVRLSESEQVSLRAQYNKFKSDDALFTIAKNYLVDRIKHGKRISSKEKLHSDASKYLNTGAVPLQHFHTEIIRVEVR